MDLADGAGGVRIVHRAWTVERWTGSVLVGVRFVRCIFGIISLGGLRICRSG